MTTKKEWVLKAFKGEKVDRVPVGFWHHFTEEEEWFEGVENSKIVEKNIAGHKKFLEEVKPDFVKLMSDGFFAYPNEKLKGLKSIKDLADIQPIGKGHPWITAQVDLVKELKVNFPEDILAIYNIFAPVTYFKWLVAEHVSQGDDLLANFLEEDAALTKKVLDVIGQDIAALSRRVIQEAGIEGIYFSVQTIQDSRVDAESYHKYISSSEIAILEAAQEAGGVSVLHICGYEGAKNNLALFVDYPAQVINWAVGPEGISLAEGRRLFNGRTVLGGFENGPTGLLYTGSEQEIKSETNRLIKEAGTEALVIGADCTIPKDTPVEHLSWVRQATVEFE